MTIMTLNYNYFNITVLEAVQSFYYGAEMSQKTMTMMIMMMMTLSCKGST